jgi:ABC-type transport system involved in cytochrome bd biosynthesis fused ATPase/permease subunit
MAEHPTGSGMRSNRIVSLRNGFDLHYTLTAAVLTLGFMKRIFLTRLIFTVGTLLEAQDNPVAEFEKKVEQQIEKRIVKEAKAKT